MAVGSPTGSAPGEPRRLVESYISGDMDAFERLVALYQDRLFSFIERLVGDPHLAEDVFQITFIKVAERAATFDHRAEFSTWLFRIARNSAIDELRKRNRDHAFYAGGPGRNGPGRGGPGPTPLDVLAAEELAADIHALLDRLPGTQREVFLLREEGDLSFEEIGEIIERGRETAKSRFRLAVEKLSDALANRGWGPQP